MNYSKTETDIFQENLDYLEGFDPELQHSVKNTDEILPFQCSKNSIYYQFTVQSQSSDHSLTHPLETTINFVKSNPLKGMFFIQIGLAEGYSISYYLKQYEKQIHHILCIEENLSVIRHFLHTQKLKELYPEKFRIIWSGSTNFELTLKNYLVEDNRFLFYKVIDFKSPPIYHQVFPEWIQEIYAKFINTLEFIKLSYGTDEHDTLYSFQNIIKNRKINLSLPGIKLLKNKFPHIPALIIAAGPSLIESIPLIKKHLGKALIISTDTGLKILLNHGIEPHFVTPVERDDVSATLFKGVPRKKLENTWMISLPRISSKSHKLFQGKNKFTALRETAHSKWLEIDAGSLYPGISSANFACFFADYIGCSPILLLGQDLCFSDDGTSHATGSMYGENQEIHFKNGYQRLTIQGNFQSKVLSQIQWYLIKRDYESHLPNLQSEILNCNNGGAKINGLKVIPPEKGFQDSIENMPVLNFPEKIRSLIPSESLFDTDSHIKSLDEKIQNQIAFLERTSEICRKNCILVKKCRELTPSEFIQQVTVIEQEINLLVKNPLFHEILLMIVQSFLHEFEMQTHFLTLNPPEKAEERKALIIRRLSEWFIHIEKWSNKLQNILKNS